MKIISRSAVVRNVLLFSLLSLGYLHIVYAFHAGKSAVSMPDIIAFLKSNFPLLALTLATIVSVFKCWKLSTYIYGIFTVTVTFHSLTIFFDSFDKVVLVFNLLYVLAAFYLYQLLYLEFSEAIYNPKFNGRDLDKRKVIDGIVLNFGDENIEGFITHLDKTSFFFRAYEKKIGIRGKAKFSLNYLSKEFNISGKVMTQFHDGYGIKVIDSENSAEGDLSWRELYDILIDRGLYSI
ncbi:hypothetical protein HBN50_16905 [Halobacteriovorax sp. GB3]|uniref:hypothetical protein n=1 Tax=Halobacteriovorax sp. GB3 TaxID=2719615 RepID=UPI0023626186|nr:hypothetical protein [Halobacteriovorax sp. GB3]MDD0854791.1 hypothetical protein [Halobacteriovorax sp. GB3]